jgi:hypothetical protein
MNSSANLLSLDNPQLPKPVHQPLVQQPAVQGSQYLITNMTEQVGILLQNLAQIGDNIEGQDDKSQNPKSGPCKDTSRKNLSGSFVSLRGK